MFPAMTDAQIAQAREANRQFDLQEEYPAGFEPERILYREIRSYDTGFGGYYSRIDKARPLVGEHYCGVADFAKKIADGRYAELDPAPQAPVQVRELDLLVTRPCFIVLSLAPEEGGWTFAGTPAQAAVTMGESASGDRGLYGGLTYVTPINVTRTRRAGCTVIFFAAMPGFGTVEDPYLQKFSYVILSDNGYNNVMDPDVRHPGVPRAPPLGRGTDREDERSAAGREIRPRPAARRSGPEPTGELSLAHSRLRPA
jgi:hypothetical protein